ncbi:DUF1189 domain-containing protein [Bacillus canaveralius]|uniref:DUF1189 domain-containing protein n=1 Tax=Bacillus canaveralius TaxID=1403243 RepID=A0A2N5GR86_9BACI|nr:DUF1189 domain-containing protein [Bacillus canaveralius]PLR85933.1 DUF1189 domain-containing protein [Bacillus canaveralius]PLS00052.1 DUF1189 domain-containing protein [Bacillus canaveralius]RSK56211.1 DUF1189 domain-containing protein [Bacillus canaveralius]
MNIFKQFFKSLYSPKDIALFRFQGIGKTILYIFFLTLLSIIPSSYFLSTALIDGVNTARESIEEDMPDFTIENGQLSSEENRPVTINKDGFTIIVDPTGAVSEKDLSNEDNAVALLQNELVLVAGGQDQVHPYSMLGLNLTKNDVTQLLTNLDSMMGILVPVMIVVIYLFSSAIKFVEISILAFFGLMLKNLAGRNLQYRHLWRMAAYSVTLPTIFFAIMGALQTQVPGGFLIHWFVSLLMLYLAIKEIPKPTVKE